jgi:hypothetical protein
MKGLSLAFFTLLLTVSCTRDAYDKGQGPYSLMRADLVEAHVRTDSLIDQITTDDGDQLTLTEPRKPSWVKQVDTLYRALFYYNKVEKNQAEVISVSSVPTVNIVPLKSLKTDMKTDPVKLESVWLAKSKSFLNVGLYVKTGQTDDKEAIHKLGVISESLQTHTNGKRTLHLRFFHDQGGMPEYYSQRTYCSIPLYEVTADSVSFTIQTYDGSVTKRFAIK